MNINATQCGLCGADTFYTARAVYAVHKAPGSERCRASGKYRDEAERMRRTFRDREHPKINKLEVTDNADSIGFHTVVAGPTSDFHAWTYLDGPDIRRLLAELTAIADARGLCPPLEQAQDREPSAEAKADPLYRLLTEVQASRSNPSENS